MPALGYTTGNAIKRIFRIVGDRLRGDTGRHLRSGPPLDDSVCKRISCEIHMPLTYDMPVALWEAPMATEMLHVRLDEKIKQQATAAFELMGLSISEGVRVFLHRVAVEQAIPFAIKVPNAATRAAMEEARGLSRARYATPDALFDALSAKGGE